MTRPDIPVGIDEIRAYYGDPDQDRDFILDPGFARMHLVKQRLPFPLRLSYNLSAVSLNIYGHRLAVDRICQFFDEVAGTYGGYKALKSQDLDIWGGCFQFRPKAGGDDLSSHCWGISFDYLPHLGPYGKPSLIPMEIIEIGDELGFENGGGWPTPDGMHNQLCRGY